MGAGSRRPPRRPPARGPGLRRDGASPDRGRGVASRGGPSRTWSNSRAPSRIIRIRREAATSRPSTSAKRMSRVGSKSARLASSFSRAVSPRISYVASATSTTSWRWAKAGMSPRSRSAGTRVPGSVAHRRPRSPRSRSWPRSSAVLAVLALHVLADRGPDELPLATSLGACARAAPAAPSGPARAPASPAGQAARRRADPSAIAASDRAARLAARAGNPRSGSAAASASMSSNVASRPPSSSASPSSRIPGVSRTSPPAGSRTRWRRVVVWRPRASSSRIAPVASTSCRPGH